MTFDEMEVGKWYWFTSRDTGIRLVGVCSRFYENSTRIVIGSAAYQVNEVTDIAPVPSQAEWAALVDAAKKAANELEYFAEAYPMRDARLYADQLRTALKTGKQTT